MSEGDAVTAESILGENGALQDGWLGHLAEDTFEKDDTGKLKQGDLADHKDLGAVVKSYLNKDKLLGTAIQPLPEKPTDEQIVAHRSRVGCPETADGYEVVKPEMPEGMVWDEDLVKACSKYAHDNHLPKGVFEGLFKMVVDGQIEGSKKLMEAWAKDDDKTVETASNQLKGKHGAKYDAILDMANRFYDLPGNDEINKAFTDLMKTQKLDSHPAVIEFMHEAYKLVKGDTVPAGGDAAGKGGTPGQLNYDKVVGDSGK